MQLPGRQAKTAASQRNRPPKRLMNAASTQSKPGVSIKAQVMPLPMYAASSLAPMATGVAVFFGFFGHLLVSVRTGEGRR